MSIDLSLKVNLNNLIMEGWDCIICPKCGAMNPLGQMEINISDIGGTEVFVSKRWFQKIGPLIFKTAKCIICETVWIPAISNYEEIKGIIHGPG